MKTISKIFFAALSIMMPWVATQAQEENIMVSNAMKYVGTPYVAGTLDTDRAEELVINADEVDCTTLVEYVLAESLTPKMANGDISETAFAENLQKIRYRQGYIDGYTSRLHYITDWIDNGVRMGFLEDVTAANSTKTLTTNLNYMTTHKEAYKILANSPRNVEKMRKIEKELSGKRVNYLPKSEVKAEGLNWIKDGDIIAITTSTPGLDVCHMGIALYIDKKLTLIHASQSDKKVVVNKTVLAHMLDSHDNWTGIRVVRMKK